MPTLEPTLAALVYASLAALAAGLGALPQALRGRLPLTLLGWSNALAAGLMLGVAYALFDAGLPGERAVVQGGIGALLGLALVRLAHLGTGTEGMDLNRLDEAGPAYGYQVVLVNTLHAGHEGVAMGVALLVSPSFGAFTALALAVHNVPEAMVLVSILASRGVRLRHAAALAVAANANQVLAAVATTAVVGALPALLPWAVGLSVGAFVYLVLAELLPESYRQAGHTSIALVTLAAMGIVVALGGAP